MGLYQGCSLLPLLLNGLKLRRSPLLLIVRQLFKEAHGWWLIVKDLGNGFINGGFISRQRNIFSNVQHSMSTECFYGICSENNACSQMARNPQADTMCWKWHQKCGQKCGNEVRIEDHIDFIYCVYVLYRFFH